MPDTVDYGDMEPRVPVEPKKETEKKVEEKKQPKKK